MDECPLCGSHVSGDECHCGGTGAGLWFLIVNHVRREDGAFIAKGCWGLACTDKAALQAYARLLTCSDQSYTLYLVSAEIVADNKKLSLVGAEAIKLYYDNLSGLDWRDFEPSEWGPQHG